GLLERSWVASELRMVFGFVLGLLAGWLAQRACRRFGFAGPRFSRFALRGSVVMLLAYGVLVVNTWWGYRQLPTGYVPNQDQGRFCIAVQLPDAASLERTQAVMDRIAEVVRHIEGVAYMTQVAGQSFALNANGSNFGNFFCVFDKFENRRDPSLTANAILDR